MININQELCTACGICGDVCPRHILEVHENNGQKMTMPAPERVSLCMACGHCIALCPNQAIQVEGLSEADFAPVEAVPIGEGDLLTLLRQRRSIRRYKDKPVPREVIDRIIAGAQAAPTGTGRISTGVLVLDKPATLATFSEQVYAVYEGLAKALKNPVARLVVRGKIGAAKVHTLESFVMPGMDWYVRWYRAGESNEILRDCPALLLFHGPVAEPMAAENCLVAAFHAILLAETLGIGTCFNDLIPPACNNSAAIREMLDLPDGREVYASITMGYPKYKFKRTPPRGLADVRYLD